MADVKQNLKDTGNKVVDAAKAVGNVVAEKAGQAADWVTEKAGGCGPVVAGGADPAAIRPHMDVISSCGSIVGKIDHLEGDAIKLTKNDSPDGQHHFIPTGWVARVDNHVHLNKDADETRRGWKADAASCANCGA
jgi:hypothetical protein